MLRYMIVWKPTLEPEGNPGHMKELITVLKVNCLDLNPLYAIRANVSAALEGKEKARGLDHTSTSFHYPPSLK